MNRKSTAQEYYTLMIDKNGLMPAMHRDEAGAGLAASAFMDLTVNDIVAVEKKKITVIKELPDSLVYLEDLYTYLKEKSRHMEKMMTDFYAGSRNKKLAEKIGESLCKDGAAVEEKGGLFAPKRVFIPEKAYKVDRHDQIGSEGRRDGSPRCGAGLAAAADKLPEAVFFKTRVRSVEAKAERNEERPAEQTARRDD